MQDGQYIAQYRCYKHIEKYLHASALDFALIRQYTLGIRPSGTITNTAPKTSL